MTLSSRSWKSGAGECGSVLRPPGVFPSNATMSPLPGMEKRLTTNTLVAVLFEELVAKAVARDRELMTEVSLVHLKTLGSQLIKQSDAFDFVPVVLERRKFLAAIEALTPLRPSPKPYPW